MCFPSLRIFANERDLSALYWLARYQNSSCEGNDLSIDQVSANYSRLQKWFSIFGRATPTGKEIEAGDGQRANTLITNLAQAAVLEANDHFDFLAGPLNKDRKVPN